MSDFDKIAASAPVNAQAAKQIGGGVDFKPNRKFSDILTENFVIRQPDSAMLVNEEFVDFTGDVYGRLKVLGL